MELAVGEFRGGEEKGNSNSNSNSNSGSKLNPLEMENVVEKILLHLDLESLRAARGVSRLWNSEGLKIVFKNHFIRLPPAPFSRGNGKKTGNKKLKEQFKEYLSLNSFKIPHLSIHSKSDASTVLKVIQEQGQGQGQLQEVRSLRWPPWFCMEKEADQTLKQLLYQLPNLNFLETSVHTNFETVKVIMDFCLATKSKSKSKSENQNEPNSKLPLVLSGFCISSDPHNFLRLIESYENFSKCQGVRIQNLQVTVFKILRFHPHLENRVLKITTDFLWRNRETLQELSVDLFETYISRINFPVMPKLSRLDFWFGGREQQQNGVSNNSPAFPESFKFVEMTRNLKEIRLCWLAVVLKDTKEGEEFWSTFFESSGSAPSVQKLVYIDDSSAGLNIDKLLQTFPNLQHFKAKRISNFESFAASVWKFGKNLNRLSFRVNMGKQVASISNLDGIFTGFSAETVDNIIKSKSKSKGGEFLLVSSVGFDVESLRVNPSILDLKGLKRVEMTFHFRGDVNKDIFPGGILSVATEFAFKLMPKTDFQILFNCQSSSVVSTAAEKFSQLPNLTFATYNLD